uniref:LLM class flavin-dependent oxidoreductase n=1 Tax=Sphingomonas sp. TaxID=28214 RepID=UPI003CC5B4CA
ETLGFDNVLLPSGYTAGIETTAFGAAIAAVTSRIRLLMAVRVGEMWPPQLARQIATIDRIAGGRLTINIISSDLPGQSMPSAPRYGRTTEAIAILRALLAGEGIDHQGEHYQLKLGPPDVRPLAGRAPPFYFGGLSEDARECAAAGADVYLMWPDVETEVAAIIADMRARAAAHGRTLRFGYRAHVIVRDTEDAARAAAARLVSRLDDAEGERIKSLGLHATAVGTARQEALRHGADGEGYAERHLWTGIGRARSGAGAAIVGDPDQVLAKLQAYQALGIEAFILSGYPHAAEADLFARHVLPRLAHGPLSL